MIKKQIKKETKKDRQINNSKEIDTRVEDYNKNQQPKKPLFSDYNQEVFDEKMKKHKHRGIHITDE
jgi:hypothetical protein